MPSYKASCQYQTCVPLLKQVYENIGSELRRKSIINLCEHWKEVTYFIKSIKDCEKSDAEEYIYKWVAISLRKLESIC